MLQLNSIAEKPETELRLAHKLKYARNDIFRGAKQLH